MEIDKNKKPSEKDNKQEENKPNLFPACGTDSDGFKLKQHKNGNNII